MAATRRATGDLLEEPAAHEPDAVADEDHLEAGAGPRLEALEPDVGDQQADPQPGRARRAGGRPARGRRPQAQLREQRVLGGRVMEGRPDGPDGSLDVGQALEDGPRAVAQGRGTGVAIWAGR